MLSFTALGNFAIKQLLMIQCPYLCGTWWTEAIKMRQSLIRGAKARKKMEERQMFSSVQVAAGRGSWLWWLMQGQFCVPYGLDCKRSDGNAKKSRGNA